MSAAEEGRRQTPRVGHVCDSDDQSHGCQHFTGHPDDPARDLAREAAARSEGLCPYCGTQLEVLALGPYCNCCRWFWLLTDDARPIVPTHYVDPQAVKVVRGVYHPADPIPLPTDDASSQRGAL